MNPVAQLSSVSVEYRLPSERIRSLKEFAIRSIAGSVRYTKFLALENVSLQISPGDFVGIVGRNGAGKTTLLKVIAGVLKPKSGTVVVSGRVAPLLGLGTGFDLELTGRENIFLNGSIFGYSRKEMAARFDRIVEYSGLGSFIEAPLRTYSSGMLTRLGFAIATDVTPEILILDEVMEVGDEWFKEKCRERIVKFRDNGVATLLVSHDLRQVRSFCTYTLWMESGRIKACGPTEEVLKEYEGLLGLSDNSPRHL